MDDLRKTLVRLGKEKPELRPDIRPVLAALDNRLLTSHDTHAMSKAVIPALRRKGIKVWRRSFDEMQVPGMGKKLCFYIETDPGVSDKDVSKALPDGAALAGGTLSEFWVYPTKAWT